MIESASRERMVLIELSGSGWMGSWVWQGRAGGTGKGDQCMTGPMRDRIGRRVGSHEQIQMGPMHEHMQIGLSEVMHHYGDAPIDRHEGGYQIRAGWVPEGLG